MEPFATPPAAVLVPSAFPRALCLPAACLLALRKRLPSPVPPGSPPLCPWRPRWKPPPAFIALEGEGCLCFLSKSARSCTRVNCSKSPINVFAKPSATEAKKFERPNKGEIKQRTQQAIRIAVVFHQLSPLQPNSQTGRGTRQSIAAQQQQTGAYFCLAAAACTRLALQNNV